MYSKLKIIFNPGEAEDEMRILMEKTKYLIACDFNKRKELSGFTPVKLSGAWKIPKKTKRMKKAWLSLLISRKRYSKLDTKTYSPKTPPIKPLKNTGLILEFNTEDPLELLKDAIVNPEANMEKQFGHKKRACLKISATIVRRYILVNVSLHLKHADLIDYFYKDLLPIDALI
ncbi:hypothetical protein BY458DRAFT_490021 [Sporodiniella umbellata]|nr:hypothetical protein BY458DRAFT_490021 [Sporodiniella umbellata]